MERYIDKETGEVFEENTNDVLRKESQGIMKVTKEVAVYVYQKNN